MTGLRPVLINAQDTGGAANATRRIHEGLRKIEVDSRMFVRRKSRRDPYIVGPQNRIGKTIARLRPIADSLPLRLYGDPNSFSLDWIPDRIPARVSALDPDIIHLNWVAGGFMSVSSLANFDAPIVWRFPDMWPMTGGCHYAHGCEGYHTNCGGCPQLDSSRDLDPSRITLGRKRRALEGANVTVVAPSSWLASCAEESTLFGDSRIEVIPNGLDTDVFRPTDPELGRELFDLPADKQLVLFGSVGPLSDPRKGFEPLQKAVEILDDRGYEDVELVVFGTNKPEGSPEFALPTHYAGYLNDEQSLSLLYAAADVMAVPSRYEGFGQTVTEAMACGTPVVAFDATGPADTVVHKESGYLAEPYDPTDLTRGMQWLLDDDELRSAVGRCARERAVARYHYTDVAEQYRELYEDILEPSVDGSP